MPNMFVILCPECEKQIKVAEAVIGKKIRCKECGHTFVVKKPKKAAIIEDEDAKEQKQTAAQVNASMAEEDEDGKNPYRLAVTDEGVARCPHCAKELESKDARICLNCGYDTVVRKNKESVAVYEPTGQEVFMWLLPGILCVVGILTVIGVSILCGLKTRGWMTDGWFHDDEDKSKWIVKPGCFIFFNVVVSAFICYVLGRFAYKRLFINNKPPEKLIKE